MRKEKEQLGQFFTFLEEYQLCKFLMNALYVKAEYIFPNT